MSVSSIPPSSCRVARFAPLLLLAAGCINENEKASPLTPVDRNETSDFDASVATEWFGALLAAIDAEDLNPPEASRRIGYAGVTLYEAVVQGSPDQVSLGQQLNGLGRLPGAPDEDEVVTHWPSAANAALARVLADLFATAQPTTLQIFSDKEAELAAQYAIDEPNQTYRDESIAFGQDVADDIIDWIADDGYATWNDCAHTAPVGDGLWVPTPPNNDPALEPCWGNLRPFALIFAAECAPLNAPPFSRAPGSPFEIEASEVYDTVNSLTTEQQDIATFWDDGAGTVTPPGHWVSITSQVLTEEDESLDVAAEAFAKVGIAVADAFISCWEIKYTYNLLRPVTYIHDAAGPINDAAWSSFIETPPAPEFSSGHATQSGAVSFVLDDLLGDVTFTDHTYDGAGLTPREFDSFPEAAEEAAISRLYGGIQFRSATERGLEQGRCIGQVILQNIDFH